MPHVQPVHLRQRRQQLDNHWSDYVTNSPLVAEDNTVSDTAGFVDENGSVDGLVDLETTALAIPDDEVRLAVEILFTL